MKSVLALAVLAIVLHFKTTASKIIIPREFEDFESDEDRIDHVNYILTRNSDTEKRAAFPHSAVSAGQCEAPDNTNIQTIVTNKTVRINWTDRPICSLVNVPVKIKTRKHSNPFPSYVRLTRCMGSSEWHPTLKYCTVIKKEQIAVKYMDAYAGQEFDSKMYNHTGCAEECIVKQHHCDPVKEKHKDCHCKCVIDNSYCDSSYQTFDPSLCKCRCTTVSQCSLYREWNPSTCQCQCAKSIKDLCKKANFVIDESTCSCVLPSAPTTNPPPPATTSPPPTTTSPSQSTTGSNSNNINVI